MDQVVEDSYGSQQLAAPIDRIWRLGPARLHH
jgi:hypothetical protein